MRMTILVTGGAGYIGSHTTVCLLEAGHDVVVVDNLVNSREESLRRVAAITGKSVAFERGDIRDRPFIEGVLKRYSASAVIHFAGLKAVGESVSKPLDYYEVNVGGTISLLQAMQAAGVRSIVFSSSATVYGEPQKLPIPEGHPLSATNPYGRTKLVIEDMLRDLYAGDPSWRIAMLRYFNPVGAHGSGLIGEDPNGIPNNLMPYVAQVGSGRLERLRVFGGDYPTPDGTGVRDFIHVVDLADGHVRAIDRLAEGPQCVAINLGTGQGYSVLDLVKAFRRASNQPIPYDIVDRRPGDVAASYADPSSAEELLDWKATRTLEDMCADTWNWQVKNPNGYE